MTIVLAGRFLYGRAMPMIDGLLLTIAPFEFSWGAAIIFVIVTAGVLIWINTRTW